MPDEKKSSEKTIEMRLAELEDKVSKIHITEEELKAYHKVNALLAGQAGAAPSAGQVPQVQMDPTAAFSPFVSISPIWRTVPRIQPRIVNECICGPCYCIAGGGTFGGGGFGGLGGG